MRASLVLFGLVLAAVSARAAEPMGDAKRGQAVFNTMGCYSCHGAVGQGNGRDGPRISPPPPYAAIVQQLRSPRYEMPAYVAASVPDQAVADIHAYLASLPRTADPKAIKALQ